MVIDGDYNEPRRELAAKEREAIERGFSDGRKLSGDLMNIWGRLRTPNINGIRPLPHYQQYMEEARTKAGSNRYPREEIDYVMSLSDPEAVMIFDALIDECNACLDDIKEKNDLRKIDEFIRRAKEIAGIVDTP